jgi:hypothetical protein
MTEKLNIMAELSEIGRLMKSARLLQSIRRKARKVCRDGKVVVTDGKHGEHHAKESSQYDVVVVTKDASKSKSVSRRLKKARPDLEVNQLVRNVLGIRTARRGKLKKDEDNG